MGEDDALAGVKWALRTTDRIGCRPGLQMKVLVSVVKAARAEDDADEGVPVVEVGPGYMKKMEITITPDETVDFQTFCLALGGKAAEIIPKSNQRPSPKLSHFLVFGRSERSPQLMYDDDSMLAVLGDGEGVMCVAINAAICKKLCSKGRVPATLQKVLKAPTEAPSRLGAPGPMMLERAHQMARDQHLTQIRNAGEQMEIRGPPHAAALLQEVQRIADEKTRIIALTVPPGMTSVPVWNRNAEFLVALNDALYTAASTIGRVPVALLNRRVIAEIAHEAVLASSSGGGRREEFVAIIRDCMSVNDYPEEPGVVEAEQGEPTEEDVI
jgi:hypothetical protein